MAEATQPTGETSTDFNRMNPYGPGALADETRQAQMREANDAIADVNVNDVFSRAQANTVLLQSANFEANADRRNKIFDALAPSLLK